MPIFYNNHNIDSPIEPPSHFTGLLLPEKHLTWYLPYDTFEFQAE
jgi:hypothetical protein